MRALVFATALCLAGCASPPASGPTETPDGEIIDEPRFDPAAWTAAVEAAETPAELVSLSEALLDAVDWRTACGEDDPTAPGRGILQLHDLKDDRTLAEITCQTRASQSSFALVDVDAGHPPRLVQSLGVSEAGEPTEEETSSFYGIVSTAGEPPGAFEVLTKSAGHGGCGLDVQYRVLDDGGAEIVRVRAHDDCDAPKPPADWPVTYPDS